MSLTILYGIMTDRDLHLQPVSAGTENEEDSA